VTSCPLLLWRIKMKTYKISLKEVHSVVWRVDADTVDDAHEKALNGDGEMVCHDYSHTLDECEIERI
jgi:hypothetical protein